MADAYLAILSAAPCATLLALSNAIDYVDACIVCVYMPAFVLLVMQLNYDLMRVNC
jgi:hypothetical protein